MNALPTSHIHEGMPAFMEEHVSNPLLKHGGLCEADANRSLHELNY